MKRGGRLSPSSKKRLASLAERPVVRGRVFARDGFRCRIAPLLTGTEWEQCFGQLTPHHLHKAGQGGQYLDSNLITACAFHNGWVENHPQLAHDLGLSIKSWEAR